MVNSMIRVIQRRLIIPRGDTGTFTLPLLATASDGDIAVFSIYDPLTKTILLQKKVIVSGQTIEFNFTREWTINIEPSDRYEWDVRIYNTPIYEDGTEDINSEDAIPIDGASIDSYYSAFSLPQCEIRPAP